MRRPAFFLAAIAAAALALAPALAEARPGGGGSVGSRGSRTYSAPPSTNTAPGTARPMERSMTEPSRQAAPSAMQQRPMGQTAPAGNRFGSSFGAGLLGGLIGVGLAGLLFGHGLFGGFTGFASFLGLLLQIALIAGLVWLVVGFFRRRQPQPAMAGMPHGMARQMQEAGPKPMPMGGGSVQPGPARPSDALGLQASDFGAFERILKAVNDAWTRQDEAAMRPLCTDEMLRYFGDELASLHQRGLRNETRDVVLEQGDLAEAWREGAEEYATVAMRFSQIDVTRRLSDGAVVEGDPNRRTQAVELWTFLRRQGGPWQVSAIQQTA